MEWYPWYPAIYRADTMHLTAEQDGIYRRLIDHYMETRQPIPNNDSAIARIAGISPDVWAMAATTILPFFTALESGKLHHKRCDIELTHQDGRSKMHSEKGKIGAKKRWKNIKEKQIDNSSGYSSAIATPLPNHSTGQDKTEEEKKVSKYRGTRFALANPPDDWIQFCVTQRPDLNAGIVFDSFRDYWLAVPGSKGVKLDWNATWRNWIRNQKGLNNEIARRNIGKPSFTSEKQRLANKYAAEAEREEQATTSGIARSNLRLTESIRQDC